MSNTDYIRDRTNQIIRARIAMGATQGGMVRKRKKAGGSKTPKRKYDRRMTVPRKRAGVMAGSRVRKACPARKYKRVGYTRKNGTHVRPACVKKRVVKKKVVKRKAPLRRQRGGEEYDEEMDLEPATEWGYQSGYPMPMNTQTGGRSRKRKVRSGWIDFVKEYSSANNISYGEALSEAGPVWRQIKNSM